MPEPLLTVENLSLNFRVEGGLQPAVREINLSLYPNEAVGLVGESGSGKSTILLAMMNHLPENAVIESGAIRYRGTDLLRADRARLDEIRGRRIAIVYQDPASALNPALTVGVQIAEVLRRHLGMAARAARARTQELMSLVRLDDPAATYAAYPHQLSGGMRQRVMIAMALACEPDVLLMDEPTTALDVLVQAHILDLVRRLHREIRSAILFVSHNLGTVAEIADRIGVLYAGELVERGTTGEILGGSRHPYTRALIAAVPRIDARDLPHGIPGATDKAAARFARCVFAGRCRFADAICRNSRPAAIALGTGTHVSRCHFAADPARIDALPAPRIVGHAGADSTAPPLLEVSRLSVEYRSAAGEAGFGGGRRIQAVRDVSFRIARRQVLALVGESGSGKSTIARALLRLEPIAGGKVVFDGADVFSLDGRGLNSFRRAAQIVFQNPASSLNPRHTVAELIERPLVLAGVALKERQQRVAAALEAVGLSAAFFGRYPHQMSGGEKQRVALARAFVTEPLLVILDEPTTALDVSVQATILELLLAQKERTHCAYLLISHDLAVVRQMADDVVVLRDGAVQEAGPVERLFAAPAHSYTRALLEAAPALPAHRIAAGVE